MSSRLTYALILSLGVAPAFGQEKDVHVQRDALGDPLPKGAVARLGTMRLFHPNTLFLAFSPDGKHLVSIDGGGLKHGEARLWDVKTGKQVHRWQTPTFGGFSPSWSPVDFSSDGRLLALAAADTVQIWEMPGGTNLLKKKVGFVPALAFSPDDKILALATKDSLVLMDSFTGKTRDEWRLNLHFAQVAFTKDGRLVAAGYTAPDRKVHRVLSWKGPTWKGGPAIELERFSSHTNSLSPDGQYLVVPTEKGGKVSLLDTSTGKIKSETEGEVSSIGAIAFTADSKEMIALGRDKYLRVWDTATGNLIGDIKTKTAHPDRVALAPDGKLAAVIGRHEGSIHLWDLTTRKELHSFVGHRNGPIVATFASDGKTILTASQDAGFSSPPRAGNEWSLRRWDRMKATELQVWRKDSPVEVRHAVFSMNGQMLVTANSLGNATLFDPKLGKEVRSWKLPTQVTTIRSGAKVTRHESLSVDRLTLSADGRLLAAPSRGEMTVYATDPGRIIFNLGLPRAVAVSGVFLPDNKSLIVSTWESPTGNGLRRLDVKTGEELRAYPEIKFWFPMLAVAANSRLAARANHKLLEVFDVDSGVVLWSTASIGTEALTFSPDSRLLASGDREGILRLWDAANGRPMKEVSGHQGWIKSLAFSPDGQSLLSAGGNTAMLWDVAGLRK